MMSPGAHLEPAIAIPPADSRGRPGRRMISPRPVIAASPYFRPRLTLRSKLILGTSILLGLVAEQRQIIGFDLVEDAGSECDGNVGARLLYKLIGFALRSQR